MILRIRDTPQFDIYQCINLLPQKSQGPSHKLIKFTIATKNIYLFISQKNNSF